MNPRPVSVKALQDYELLVTFENDEVKVFDVKPLLHRPVFKALTNKALFNIVKIVHKSVYWNEDLDICPDMVYEDSRTVEDAID